MWSNRFALVGRMLLVAIFFISAWGKIQAFDNSVAYIAGKGLPLPQVALVLAIVVEILGALSVGLGLKPKLGALLLVLFMLPTTFIFHAYWNVDPAQTLQLRIEMLMFLKNLAIIGGLLMVVANGAGDWTLDRALARMKYKRAVK